MRDADKVVEKGQPKEVFDDPISNTLLHEKITRSAGAAIMGEPPKPNPIIPQSDPVYRDLLMVMQQAYTQAAKGKGKERHTKKKNQHFDDQPICALQRLYGNGYAFGQVGKKMEEAQRLPYEQARAELLGAINYLCAAVIVLDENQ